MNGEVKNNKTGLLPAGGSPVAFFLKVVWAVVISTNEYNHRSLLPACGFWG